MQYDFSGRKDLVKFVKIVAQAGLYVHLRIGPYVCAEWNYGYGFYSISFPFCSLGIKRKLLYDDFTYFSISAEFYCVIVFLFQLLNSGFPLWLHFIPGIQLRTDNEPFKVSIANCLLLLFFLLGIFSTSLINL